MAAFKVGQLVRLIRYSEISWRIVPIGHEGRIAEVCGDDAYRVYWPGYEGASRTGLWRTFAWQLAPLLPPDSAADQFLARIRKLGSEPVNDAPKVTVREGK